MEVFQISKLTVANAIYPIGREEELGEVSMGRYSVLKHCARNHFTLPNLTKNNPAYLLAGVLPGVKSDLDIRGPEHKSPQSRNSVVLSIYLQGRIDKCVISTILRGRV